MAAREKFSPRPLPLPLSSAPHTRIYSDTRQPDTRSKYNPHRAQLLRTNPAHHMTSLSLIPSPHPSPRPARMSHLPVSLLPQCTPAPPPTAGSPSRPRPRIGSIHPAVRWCLGRTWARQDRRRIKGWWWEPAHGCRSCQEWGSRDTAFLFLHVRFHA